MTELVQVGKMFLTGVLMMLTAHEKQAFAWYNRWRYRSRMVVDFWFCIIWAILLWLVFLKVSGGLVRYYLIFGLLIGMLFYHVLCRKRTEWVCNQLAKILSDGWHGICKIVFWPWKMLYQIGVMPFIRKIQKYKLQKQEFVPTEENNIEIDQ